MTAPELLFYISAALLFQVSIGVSVAAARWKRGIAAAPIEVGPPAQPLAWPGLRAFRVLRRPFEDAQRSQCSFYLAPVDGAPLPPFRPGQFLTFALDVPQGEGGVPRPVTRCYSLSDAPRPEAYRITVKRVAAPADQPELPPGVASTHLHDRVQRGDVLHLRAPSGRFFLAPDADIPAVLVAGGIGITPMMSMLAWSLEQQPGRVLHLFYGLRHSGEHAFKAVLEALAARHPGFRLSVIYSQPRPGDVAGRDYQHQGRIDVALLRQTLPVGRHAFYVCGPPPMMASLIPDLLAWGVAPADLHHEAFGPASLVPVPPAGGQAATAIDIQFRRSGRTLAWTGQDASLLDFAERHGLAVESGCRSGSCGSCETGLVSGSIRYATRPDHELAAGRCLLCVGTPGSALVLDA